jgi:hypothetical protein
MINSAPSNSNYKQGLYVPNNKDKVIKLNSKGGLFYRSSWEKRIMIWLDNKPEITKWGAECIIIPYISREMKDDDLRNKERSYYPDFYYELKSSDGSIQKVVAEVKPHKDFEMACKFLSENIKIKDNLTVKGLKNLEYDFKMAQKNAAKWTTMIDWCQKKGFEFIIITEITLNNYLK